MKPAIFQLLRIIALFILCAHSYASQASLPIRFAPEKDYGPFIFQDAQGQLQGLSWDMLQALSVPANLDIQPLPGAPLATILEQVRRGEVDLISSLRPTEKRAQYLDFTQPYVAVPAVLIARYQDEKRPLNALAGKKVAVGRGYAVEAYVRKNYPQVNWLAVSDDKQALQRLRSGEVEAFVADLASVIFIAKAEQFSQWQVVQNIGFQYQLSFAYPKNRPEIGERLNQGLLSLGFARRQAIVARWLNVEQLEQQRAYRAFIFYLVSGLLAIGGLWSLRQWLRAGRRIESK